MKKIGLIGATAIGLGAIIGAGIFVLSGTTIALAGTGALLAFILTGVVAVTVALEVGELSSKMPGERGANYSFIYNAFGSELGFISGILLFLAYMASVSAISLGFGTYLANLIGMQNFSITFAIFLITLLTFINYLGVKRVAGTDVVLVAFKIFVLLIFIFFALTFGRFDGLHFSGLLDKGFGGIFAASVIAMFAYAGFQSIASLTPDIKGGGRTAAKAIILSVIISAMLYIAVTASLLALAPASSYTFIADPLGFALKYSGAPNMLFILVGLAALAATASASLAMLVGGSRLLEQMSIDSLLPKCFSWKDKKYKTPKTAIIMIAILSLITLFAGNIYIIAAISNFGLLFSYLLTGLAITKVRRLEKYGKKVNKKGNVFSMPLYPHLTVLSIVMLILFFYGFPLSALSDGIAVVLASIVVYYIIREVENKPVIKLRFFD